MKSFFSFLFEVFKITVITLAIILPVRYFLMQPFFVKGASMEPSFDDNQYLIIDEISYRVRQPERGEVIVFKYPVDPTQYYIKRVIGLPGETVEVVDGQVKIFNNEHPLGFVLDESKYLPLNVATYSGDKTTLGEGEYFVLGDNRSASYDSRRWGAVSFANITGRVWLRAWPPQTAKAFGAPEYSY
ncbi:MAG: signal peptidase I [Candidatus Portnoybacteria bacterium RIFCSPLOWO2_02_FULL_39_11]|uniref:Signal peptidase I n=1 Tax=Candidatus Portnoybacteria bacterium RIFCSPLOWO2_02_FULL_39_11 TaxID=1802001 RepID=A0A1G2FW37_9BACT|nr:MAG: signal peptidase I [Candidatus Portnoybacteria bacterium RIFCSPLOWO2_02_FULL_39_11]